MKKQENDWAKKTEEFFAKEKLERLHVPAKQLAKEGWFSSSEYSQRVGVTINIAGHRLRRDPRFEQRSFWVEGSKDKIKYFRLK